jgi:hypothetical protein
MAQRIKTVQESDLRMLGDLARSIQRVLPVTQADIDAAAALGKGWVVTRVFEVSDPLDNLRGGTQLVIRQNSILPGQSVQRVLIVSGPGGQTVVVRGTDYIVLPDAIANSLSYVKAFGGTYQGNIPAPYTQVNYVTNTAQTAIDTGVMIDFAKNYEFEVECRAVGGSWYILQSRASSTGNITGIHGATSGSTITLVVGNVTVCTSAITRTAGNKLYVKATLNAGTATLYVKDETANTEDTQTGSYGTSQPNPTAAVYLLGNAGGQYVDVNSDIYMARIKENDTVVMDYVPARQVATAGFYDKASGTFKTAETPANLSADGNTVPTPDAPMDIVCNNGVLKWDSVNRTVYADGTQETIVIKGPNLWNMAEATVSAPGFLASSITVGNDGTISATNNSNNPAARFLLELSADNLGLINGQTYTVKVWTVENNFTTDRDSTIIVNGSQNAFRQSSPISKTWTQSGSNPVKITLYFAEYSNGSTASVRVQVSKASSIDNYTPYSEQTATCEDLLSIGNDKDQQEIIDGTVTRIIGYKIFNGTETFGTSNAYGKALYINAAASAWGADRTKAVLCTHFLGKPMATAAQPLYSCFFNNSRHFYFRTEETAANFKTWVAQQYAAGTPVILFFVKEIATTETVTAQTLQVTAGDNVLEITQASLTGLELEVEYQAAVSLTIQEVQDANLDPNVEVTIN